MSVTTKKSYPTALPHRSPQSLADQCAIWRGRTYGLFAFAIVATAIAVGAIIVAYNEVRATRENAGLAPTPANPAPEPVAKPLPPIAAKPELLTISASTKPQPKKVAPAASSEREVFLEALGSLSAAHLFQSYLNIGLLADGVESEVYTTKQAEDTLASISEMMDNAEANLTKLTKLGLDPEDNAALEQVRTATELLRLQSKYLKNYWQTGDKEEVRRYHEVRQAAWKGLTKVLQLEAK